jgi:hypothetical protein
MSPAMPALTLAALASYPGSGLTEKLAEHHAEGRALPLPVAGRRAKRLPLVPCSVDVRAYPGRDRTERVVMWLRASVPQAHTWSEESLRELAERLLATANVVG